MQSVDVAIVEPSRLFREGLQKLLCGSPFAVVSAGGSAAETFESAGGASADLVILGPGTGGEAEMEVDWVCTHQPAPHRPRFVLLSDALEPARLRRAAAAGVDAVLSQDISGEVLRRSLDLVMLGQQLFPAVLAHAQSECVPAPRAGLIPFPVPGAARPQAPQAERTPRPNLSERETQILCCLAGGMSNKAIARELRIQEATVKAHVKALLRKIGAANRTQAAIWAHKNPRPRDAAVGAMPPVGAPSRHSAA